MDGAEFTIIAPNKKYDNPNEASIGLILEHKENSFLFTGDAEEAENDILNSGRKSFFKVDMWCQ